MIIRNINIILVIEKKSMIAVRWGKKNNLEIRLSKFCSMTRKDDYSKKKKAMNVALYLPLSTCTSKVSSKGDYQEFNKTI